MEEMRVLSLVREDSLKKEMVTRPSIPTWRTPWTKEPVWLQSMESQRVGHGLLTEQQQIHVCAGVSALASFLPNTCVCVWVCVCVCVCLMTYITHILFCIQFNSSDPGSQVNREVWIKSRWELWDDVQILQEASGSYCKHTWKDNTPWIITYCLYAQLILKLVQVPQWLLTWSPAKILHTLATNTNWALLVYKTIFTEFTC